MSDGPTRRLAVALGGGGARGAAHVGVLEELERLSFRPTLITGTSIGGLIGALVACGMALDEINEIGRAMRAGKLYSFPGSGRAFVGNDKLEELLDEWVGERTFEELEIPLAIVATDIIGRKEVVLDRGPLKPALLATMSLPLLFPPVPMGEWLLVDGGVVNNTPFSVATARGATHVVAIDLSNSASFGTPVEHDPLPGGLLERALGLTQRLPTWQVASSLIDMITAATVRSHLAAAEPDVLLRPDLGTVGLLDFHRWDEAHDAGRDAARRAESRLVALTSSDPPL